MIPPIVCINLLISHLDGMLMVSNPSDRRCPQLSHLGQIHELIKITIFRKMKTGSFFFLLSYLMESKEEFPAKPTFLNSVKLISIDDVRGREHK